MGDKGYDPGVFVILHPHTLTNPSDKFRVVEWVGWFKLRAGTWSDYPFVSYDSYAAAERARDAMNHPDR